MHDKKGVFKWYDGKIYEGEFAFNQMHGKGKLSFPKNGVSVQGIWERGHNVRMQRVNNT